MNICKMFIPHLGDQIHIYDIYKKNIKDTHWRIAIHIISEILPLSQKFFVVQYTTKHPYTYHTTFTTRALTHWFSSSPTCYTQQTVLCIFISFLFKVSSWGNTTLVSQPSYHCVVCMGLKKLVIHWILLMKHAWHELQIQDDPPSFSTLWQHAAAAFHTATFSSLQYSFLYHLLIFFFPWGTLVRVGPSCAKTALYWFIVAYNPKNFWTCWYVQGWWLYSSMWNTEIITVVFSSLHLIPNMDPMCCTFLICSLKIMHNLFPVP
jgi:hypothetical protein